MESKKTEASCLSSKYDIERLDNNIEVNYKNWYKVWPSGLSRIAIYADESTNLRVTHYCRHVELWLIVICHVPSEFREPNLAKSQKLSYHEKILLPDCQCYGIGPNVDDLKKAKA